MFTKVNSKVVSVDIGQTGPVIARRGAMLFYTGQVLFQPHQIAGAGGGGFGGGGFGAMAGRALAGEHESTMIAQGNGVVHYGFRGIEVQIVDLGAVGGVLRVEASRLLVYSCLLYTSPSPRD